jgi:hypothetical protein
VNEASTPAQTSSGDQGHQGPMSASSSTALPPELIQTKGKGKGKGTEKGQKGRWQRTTQPWSHDTWWQSSWSWW